MRRALYVIVAAMAFALGTTAAVMASPPAGNPGSPGDNCSEGNSNKSCVPDPSPNGKDCEDHGNARGNENHCDATTTTTETTTDETTTQETTTVPDNPGNPPETTTSPVVLPNDSTTIETTTTPAPPVQFCKQVPAVCRRPKQSSHPVVDPKKIVKVTKKSTGVLVIKTADGRSHVAIQGQG